MFTLIESSIFSRWILEYLSEEEYDALKIFLAVNPEAGDVIPGTGGIRKLRWARAGMGKRGGIRVIYFIRNASGEIALLTVYTKSRTGNAPAHLLRQLREGFENGKI